MAGCRWHSPEATHIGGEIAALALPHETLTPEDVFSNVTEM
jgi:hypothetical protein